MLTIYSEKRLQRFLAWTWYFHIFHLLNSQISRELVRFPDPSINFYQMPDLFMGFNAKIKFLTFSRFFRPCMEAVTINSRTNTVKSSGMQLILSTNLTFCKFDRFEKYQVIFSKMVKSNYQCTAKHDQSFFLAFQIAGVYLKSQGEILRAWHQLIRTAIQYIEALKSEFRSIAESQWITICVM